MAYTPFKMKGHTLPGINQKSEGNTDTPEGRSASSAFQYKKSPTKQVTREQRLTPEDVTPSKDPLKAPEKQASPTKHSVTDAQGTPREHGHKKDGSTKYSPKQYYDQIATDEEKAKYISKKGESPGKWVQFIPMALSALGSMGGKKEE